MSISKGICHESKIECETTNLELPDCSQAWEALCYQQKESTNEAAAGVKLRGG